MAQTADMTGKRKEREDAVTSVQQTERQQRWLSENLIRFFFFEGGVQRVDATFDGATWPQRGRLTAAERLLSGS